MTPAEIERGLIAAGVPKELARRRALASRVSPLPEHVITASPVIWPVRFVLPWSALVSDNDKYAATLSKHSSGQAYPRLLLTPRYRAAKAKAHVIAKDAMAGSAPAAYPLALVARVWVPDNRPGHDVCNFGKCLLDACENAVVVNDQWFHSVTIQRAGTDVDAPRAEIMIDTIL